MQVGDAKFPVNVGVAQGDILAPNLFAIYLDAAIQENQVLRNLVENQKLYAYADDIVVVTETQEEMASAIEALESLELGWDLCLNKKKSQILSKDIAYGPIDKANDQREFKGISVRLSMDYLGMTLHSTKAETIKAAEKKVKRKIKSMKGQFRCIDQTLN